MDIENQLRQLQRQYLRCIFVCAVVAINFIAFVVIAAHFGGDALNGKFENGHYYVFGVTTDSSGKIYTEVSKHVFDYSRLHALSVLLTWPAGMAAMFRSNKLKAEIETFKSKAPTENNPKFQP